MSPATPHSALRTPHFCRVCRADLSRATEDLVRCPACMCFQVLSLPDDPAYRLVGRHRWVRFLPYLTVFLFWFAVVVTFRMLDRSLGWGLVTAVMTTAAWVAAVAGFRRACEAVPGWALCLAEFHVACAILLAAAYTGLKALQAWDDLGWQALLGVRPVLAVLGATVALGLSVDAIRRGDAMRLKPVGECGVRSAECERKD